MIQIDIPGFKNLALHHLVLDYNGTLAVDGILLAGVEQALNELAQHLQIHILTADTFGTVESQVKQINASITILDAASQAEAKHRFVLSLGADHTVCVGNGRNDRLMLGVSALGIAVIQPEGASSEACLSASVVCTGILPALQLLQNPKRLMATLRS